MTHPKLLCLLCLDQNRTHCQRLFWLRHELLNRRHHICIPALCFISFHRIISNWNEKQRLLPLIKNSAISVLDGVLWIIHLRGNMLQKTNNSLNTHSNVHKFSWAYNDCSCEIFIVCTAYRRQTTTLYTKLM